MPDVALVDILFPRVDDRPTPEPADWVAFFHASREHNGEALIYGFFKPVELSAVNMHGSDGYFPTQ